jgi:hypothetical protein
MPHARAKLRPFVLFFIQPDCEGRLLPLLLLRGPHMNLAGLTLLLVALATSCGAIDNGLGRTPP